MSSKAQTNRAWSSTPRYRSNYDAIFAKVCDASCPHHNVAQAMALHLEAITTAANQHKLARWKQLCAALDCKGCEERLASVRDYLQGSIVPPNSLYDPQVKMRPLQADAQAPKASLSGGSDEVSV